MLSNGLTLWNYLDLFAAHASAKLKYSWAFSFESEDPLLIQRHPIHPALEKRRAYWTEK